MRADRRVLQQPPIRLGRDADAPGIIALIRRCWADYPGCVLDLEVEERALLALATYYHDQGGTLWVTDGIIGMVAARPRPGDTWEICRVYVHPDHHGTGLGHTLLDVAEAHAAGQGAHHLELWTDTRFGRAHGFYEKRGYVRGGRRALHDLSDSEEWQYGRAIGLAG